MSEKLAGEDFNQNRPDWSAVKEQAKKPDHAAMGGNYAHFEDGQSKENDRNTTYGKSQVPIEFPPYGWDAKREMTPYYGFDSPEDMAKFDRFEKLMTDNEDFKLFFDKYIADYELDHKLTEDRNWQDMINGYLDQYESASTVIDTEVKAWRKKECDPAGIEY